MSNIPEILINSAGHPVNTYEQWTSRRDEIAHTLACEVFGFSPDPSRYSVAFAVEDERTWLDGLATYRKIRISVAAELGVYSFPMVLSTPVGATAPCPVFLHITNRFPSSQTPYEPVDDFCDVRGLISNSFASAMFYTADVSPDADGQLGKGICGVFERTDSPSEWNTIAAWAFGASRCMDYLAQSGLVDASRVALIGHSRAGKTALWAGCRDPRFAMIIANESGCTGAALERGKIGETTEKINGYFPYWFCEKYKSYNGKPDEMPFDFHWLVASSAPRPVCISSAAEDLWADPSAEYRSCYLASKVYDMLGLRGGIDNPALPEAGTHLMEGYISYHIRAGEHDLNSIDWDCFVKAAKTYFEM